MKSCEGCANYLGGGQCRCSLELECAAGGGYEAYEPVLRREFSSLQELAEYAGRHNLIKAGFKAELRKDGTWELR